MSTTPDLIESLATGLRPVPRRFVARRLGLGIGTGASLASAYMLVAWGPRPDIEAALATLPLWIKFAFTGLLALSGIVAALHLSRPDGRWPRRAWIVGVAVIAAMVALAALQLLNTSPSEHYQLIMGKTAAVCPWLIMLLSVPLLIGALWAMRSMAPTRPALAGAACGLAAGASAAFIYAFSCDESAMPFVLIWYGLGMAVPAVAGALIGRRLLRW